MKKIVYVFLTVILLVCGSLLCVSCGSSSDVDMDLASLNNKSAYAGAYNIYSAPADYDGKIVRIKGTFSSGSITGASDKEHYFVDVYDGTCCTTWVAFSWNGDLPVRGRTLTVTGVLKAKTENGSVYPEIEATSVEF